MPKFKYKAKKDSGEIYESTFEGKDRFAIYGQVHDEKATIISIKEVKGMSFLNVEKINIALSKVKTHQKIIFARNLSSMLEAGLSLTRAISVMEKQTKNPKFKFVLSEVNKGIEKGNSFYVALGKFPKVFSPLFVSMVRAGEESGKLSDSLRTISDQMDRTYTLKKKIQGALIYPSIIIVALFAVGTLMLIFIVPTLASTFEEMGVDLPASTKFIIGFSNFLVNNYILAAILFVSFVGGFILALRTSKGKKAFEFFLLHVPIISGLVREINSARTARTMSSLLSSGVGMVSAINITQGVVQNSYYKDVLKTIEDHIQKGGKISEILSKHENLYPIMMTEMIAVGEETGKLSDMLFEVAKFFEEEVSQKTKNMSTIIEPILMLIVGVGVGFFAISMITPIYSISETI